MTTTENRLRSNSQANPYWYLPVRRTCCGTGTLVGDIEWTMSINVVFAKYTHRAIMGYKYLNSRDIIQIFNLYLSPAGVSFKKCAI